ncbi:phosphotransferase family protein [Pseudonocardia kunmingensis]|uniref:Aminoglycoside phosphotransferase (APT) family kinase protein n=1 Tax=Pseudonocardia kunmingensis TaxID=630975 RepID=A0A543DPP8_9PSEU|nr:phosphotransferase family protein [Pseudonocardia kunmingensis]TQM11306.1 aminoglycoside phosphotransferase (APT) family kinase protein [Pseudonocardia kunmingensis]
MTTSITLPDDVLAWIEQAAGSTVVNAERIPGGGMREGWFVDLAAPGGAVRELFLRYSPAPLPGGAFHTLGVEAEVVHALRVAGAVVPTVHAVHPEREAVLLERVPGDTWFYRISDPDEQVRVAQDFIRALATVHRLDPATLDVPGLGPVRSAREHALERIAQIRARAAGPDGTIDPLLQLSIGWLERNVPDYDGPVVLVQGDTGPGNFLYQDGRVTAVLDWELSHFGDPMDDIAWLSLRTVQDTFTHLPDRLAEYAALSGHEIDEHRVRYYRVFAETTMATLRPVTAPPPAGSTPETVTRDLGNALLYGQLHRRLWLEALNDVMGLGLQAPELPEPAEYPEWDRHYGEALAMLRTVTPRIEDPLAAQWTKGAARILRHLREQDRSGRQYAERERDEIAQLLGHAAESLPEGRAALAEASRSGRVPDEEYVRYLWNKVMREDHLMRTASGSLRERTWPPLR